MTWPCNTGNIGNKDNVVDNLLDQVDCELLWGVENGKGRIIEFVNY